MHVYLQDLSIYFENGRLSQLNTPERIFDILQSKEYLEDMKRFNRLAVGRELRMIELKKEVDSLLVELGRKIKYGLEKEGISRSNSAGKSVSSVVESVIDQDNNEEV